jgi:hypothetical protein
LEVPGFRSPPYLSLEELSVVPAEVLAARVELLVDRQPHRLAIKVLEQIACRAPARDRATRTPQAFTHRDGPVVEQAMV